MIDIIMKIINDLSGKIHTNYMYTWKHTAKFDYIIHYHIKVVHVDVH